MASQQATSCVFEARGAEVKLLDQQLVDRAPLSVVDLAAPMTPGVYVDVRGADDEPLARVRVEGAMPETIEVFPEQLGQVPERIPIDGDDVSHFAVAVPLPQGGAQLVVLQAPTVGPVRRLASFPITVQP